MSKVLIGIGAERQFFEPGPKAPYDFVVEENGYFVACQTNKKFYKDSVYLDDSKYLLVLDGVVLNKSELIANSDQDWPEYILELYQQKGDAFFDVFRGSFLGALYDKVKDKWILFQDHIGSKKYFYAGDIGQTYFFSSDFDGIVTAYKRLNFAHCLNVESAYMLLSYGYMLEDRTLSADVKRFLPGSYAIINQRVAEHKNFYSLENSPNLRMGEGEIIEQMDKLFSKAIALQFEKDREYGFKHFVALSGGLDSRMTCWVAHEMGYQDQVNFTFSQSDYLDETVPKKIASDLKHEWIFKSLDNGIFLKSLDEVTKITGGNVMYHGIAHGLSLYNLINFEKFGVCHSGQLGDVVFGSFIKTPGNEEVFVNGDGAYSKKLVHKVGFDRELFAKYANKELFCMYQRGFNGANNGLLGIQQYTETASPFYDVDLLNFAMTIPVKYRSKQKIYKKWILGRYPKAGDYIWEKTGEKVNSRHLVIKGIEVTPKKVIRKVMQKTNLLKLGYNSKNNMNPVDFWLRTNPELRLFFQDYFEDNIERLDHVELKNDCIQHFNNGNGIEKIQVLSLLAAVKMYFCN